MDNTPKQAALSNAEDIVALSNSLNRLADTLHEALRRLTSQCSGDTSIAYALLTEEYALRARTNILRNDAPRHVLSAIDFSQSALLERLEALDNRLRDASSLEVVQSIVSDLLTFASAICPGKARVVNFLAKELGVQG